MTLSVASDRAANAPIAEAVRSQVHKLVAALKDRAGNGTEETGKLATQKVGHAEIDIKVERESNGKVSLRISMGTYNSITVTDGDVANLIAQALGAFDDAI